ncbi:MAG: hypothetical protein ACXQTJ_04400 [Candidatus Syntropharchaeales archaeon]|nr:hypothetical protein [Candidatus Syntrophoarchaeum sp.]
MKNSIAYLTILILCYLLLTPPVFAQSSQLEASMNHIFVTPDEDHLEIVEVLVLKNVANTSFNGTIATVPFDGWKNLEASAFTGEIPPNESLQLMFSYWIDTPEDTINLTRVAAYDTRALSMFVPLRGGVKLLDKGSFDIASGRTLEDGEYYVLESYNLPAGSTIWALFGIPRGEEKPENDYNIGMIVLILALITIALFPNLRDYLKKQS